MTKKTTEKVVKAKKPAALKASYICFNMYNGYPDDVTVEDNLGYADSYDFCIKVLSNSKTTSHPKILGEITVS